MCSILGLLGASVAPDAAVSHVARQQMAEFGTIQAEVSTRIHLEISQAPRGQERSNDFFKLKFT
jgi:hypothetical protein